MLMLKLELLDNIIEAHGRGEPFQAGVKCRYIRGHRRYLHR